MSGGSKTTQATSRVSPGPGGTALADAVGTRQPDGPGRTARRLRWLRPVAVPAGLALIHILLALLVFDPTPHTGGDGAGYIALARSLLERHEYVRLHDPALPAETRYPPAFPALLAFAMLVGVRSWTALKLVMVAVSGAAVALGYVWLRRWSSPGLALGVTAVLAVSPGVLDLSHWILSDVPFWAFTMLALWGFEAYARASDGGNTNAAAWLATAILATVLAYFTRSAGLPLLMAAAGWLAICRHWRALAVFAATALPLAALWWLRSQTGGADYVNEFLLVDPYRPELGRAALTDLLARPLANGRKYATLHLPILLFGRAHPLLLPASVIVLGLAATGWLLRVRRAGLIELFLPLYLGLLLVWPAVWSGERFLLPALPLVLGYAGLALVRFAGWADKRAAKPAAAVAVAMLLLLAVPGLDAAIRHGTTCTRGYLEGERYPCLAEPWHGFFRIAVWSGQALPDDAVVISRKPRLFFALSGHRGLIYPFSEDPAEFFAAAADAGARYVVLDGVSALTTYYLRPALLERPHAFCLMRASGADRAAVLGIRPERSAEPPGQAGPAAPRLQRCPDDYWRAKPR